MFGLFCFVLAVLALPFKSKSRLEAENAVLRHQLIVLQRKVHGRVRLTNNDRWFLIQLYRWFPSILQVVTIVQPETLVRWRRSGFRCYWRWKSRLGGGRPQIETDLRALIRRMGTENPFWGAPRIHGELLKLGFEVAQSSVAKYMVIREAVTRNRQVKLTALLHHLTVDVLRASFFGLKKSAAPGVDEMTWTEYAGRLEENLLGLHSRVQTGAYRALPSRRTYIPKADGRQRPLGIAALEDKIVQAAVVAILTPIYEAEFLGFSYGFRPKRNQHQALDALAFGIGRRRINWVLDCDVQSFFDKVNQSWLIRFVEHRIGDRRIIRLIAKWLTAGVLEGGHLIVTEEGTPQGAVISPLLANIYLHYVYDLWTHRWRQRCATGDVIVVRYADDTIVGFEHQHEAEQFLADLKARLARFGLTLHPDKTRLIEFGRSAIANRQYSGSRQAGVVRLPRVHAFLRDPSKRLGLRAREETGGQANACQASRDQGAAHGYTPRRDRKAGPLALPGSARLDGLLCRADERFGDLSIPASHDRTLARRSDASKPTTSINVDENEADRRPAPAVPTHPAPVARKEVPRHHPRWEPGALAALAGICAGGGEKSPSLPRPPTLRHLCAKGWLHKANHNERSRP